MALFAACAACYLRCFIKTVSGCKTDACEAANDSAILFFDYFPAGLNRASPTKTLFGV
jgi:hypothetical protein